MIDGKTNILGVIGDPIEHTFSPAMQNAGLQSLGLNYVYLPFHVKGNRLSDAIGGAKGLGIKGLNVTIPHKSNVIPFLDDIDPIARMIGAVNTIKFDYGDGEVFTKGFNTDAYGCLRAIAFQMACSGIDELSILNRNYEKAKSLKEELRSNLNKQEYDFNNVNAYEIDDLKRVLDSSDILIDTTPIGMYPNVNDKPIASADMMHEDLVVNDIVYTPMETSLIKEAKKANAEVVYGYKMLLYQGIRSFEIWLGKEAPVNIMEKALLDVLGI